MHKWIEIEPGKGFEQLEGLLSPEFEGRRVAKRLTEGLTSRVARVLLEFNYVDKDYRSTYYHYYAKKGRRYRPDCVRLHFFDRFVSADVSDNVTALSCQDDKIADHYFGYAVLRPTLHPTVGRSLLSPDIRQGASGFVIVSTHSVHVLGYRLVVAGFPSMDQHIDIAVCAHVACWSVLRHYSQRFPRHPEFLLQEVIKMAHPFDPGGLVPSNGLLMAEAERVFQAAGTYPLVVAKGDDRSSFYSQLLAYLESGFPLFVSMEEIGHAAVVVGHAFEEPAPEVENPDGALIGAWRLLSHFNVVDDNNLPYMAIVGPSADEDAPVKPDGSGYGADSFDKFIVALPEKIYYSAAAVEKFALKAAEHLLGFKPGDCVCRFFVTTLSTFRQEVRKNASQYSLGFVDVVMNLAAAQFLWIVEFSTIAEWGQGKISGRAVLDATAGVRDPNPAWLMHTQTNAIVFDRSDANNGDIVLDISTAHGAPLTRMNLNLRPIVRSP